MNKWIVLLVLLSLFNFAATCEKAPEVAEQNEPQASESYHDDEITEGLSASYSNDEEEPPESDEPDDEDPQPETEDDDNE